MTGGEKDTADLSSVIGPPGPPAAEPDELTRQALREGKGKKLTPIDRFADSEIRHIATLKDDKKALQEENQILRNDLFKTSQNYASLTEVYKSVFASGNATSMSMFLGSCLISAASFFSIATIKYSLMVGGWVAVVFGGRLAVVANKKRWTPSD